MDQPRILFVTGGARSGKSAYAQRAAEAMPGRHFYVATAQVRDDEMERRVHAHKLARDGRWSTIEETLDLARVVDEAPEGSVLLVDCLTIWTSNLMEKYEDDQEGIYKHIDDLAASLEKRKNSVVLVTNEVGLGIVPMNKLAREFRDLAGTINQRICSIADDAFFVVSGRALRLS